MAKQWYVIHTYSGFEKHVKTLIDKEVERRSLQEEIGEVLIPTEDVIKHQNGKKVISKQKTFPGYIVINMEMNKDLWHVIKSIPKVTGFVGGTDPFAIPEKDVENMLALARSEAPRIATKYIKGDNVDIIDGPFKEFSGVVDEVMAEKEKLRVLVSVFGRQTPVELNYYEVKIAESK